MFLIANPIIGIILMYLSLRSHYWQFQQKVSYEETRKQHNLLNWLSRFHFMQIDDSLNGGHT